MSEDLIALNLRRDQYNVLAEAVGSAIDEADPIGLLAMGCPGDEYSQEIVAIVPRVSKASDSSEAYEPLAQRVWEAVVRFQAGRE